MASISAGGAEVEVDEGGMGDLRFGLRGDVDKGLGAAEVEEGVGVEIEMCAAGAEEFCESV